MASCQRASPRKSTASWRSVAGPKGENLGQRDREAKAEILQQQMRQAAAELDFETAAKLRDQLFALTGQTQEKKIAPGMPGSRRKARGRTRK